MQDVLTRVRDVLTRGGGCTNPGAGCTNPGAGCTNPGAGCTNPGAGCTNPGAGCTNPMRVGCTNPGAGGGRATKPLYMIRYCIIAGSVPGGTGIGAPIVLNMLLTELCMLELSSSLSESSLYAARAASPLFSPVM